MSGRIRSTAVSSLRTLMALGIALATSFSLSAQSPRQQPSTPAPNLSDAEVAHVAVTANSIDIELARFAETRARHADVRAFAATMIRDHTAVNARATALATKLDVTPLGNAVSESLTKGAAEARSGLEPITGRAFDRAYVEREVAYHQAVLDAIDGLLIPTTQNGELKALLVDVRPAIAAHLEHAKQLRTSLAAQQR